MKVVVGSREICGRRFWDTCRRRTTRAVPLVDQGVLRPAQRISRFIVNTSATRANTSSFTFRYHIVVFYTFVDEMLLRWLRFVSLLLYVVVVWRRSWIFNTFASRMFVCFGNKCIGCKPGTNIDLCDWLFVETRAKIFWNRQIGWTGSGRRRGQVLSRVSDCHPRHVTRWTNRFYNHRDVISATKE